MKNKKRKSFYDRVLNRNTHGPAITHGRIEKSKVAEGGKRLFIPTRPLVFCAAIRTYLHRRGEVLDPKNSNVQWLLRNGLIKAA